MRGRNFAWTAAAAFAALPAAFGQNPCPSGPQTGAAFVTDPSGNLVPGGIFADPNDVYLNGSSQAHLPCPPAAPGLPDGDYYWQITNGDSSILLSTDDIEERRVHASGGILTAYLGSTHATGPGDCGGVSVQLAPFTLSPDADGRHRTWLTRVEDFNLAYPGATFGFRTNCTRKDNFYIVAPPPPPDDMLMGHKFYDKNTDGVWDPATEPCIDGWRIELTPGVVDPTDVAFTGSCGGFAFVVPTGSGPYTVCEVLPPSKQYVNTTALCIAGALPGASNLDFGNVCLGAGGGKTPGFWSNKNGKAQIAAMGTAGVLASLSALNLRNANGANYDPPSYTSFKSWLLNGTATNMAYMLSVHLAAMHLNVMAGFVDSGDLIYAPGTGSANAAGFASVSAILAEANAALGADGFTPDGDPNRALQEALKNALDNANNNLNFVQDEPCAFSTPY